MGVGTLAEKNDEFAAERILSDFIEAEETKLKNTEYRKEGYSLDDFISTGYDHGEFLETFKELMSFLFNTKFTYPILVAVDEWNARFSQDASCEEVLHAFDDNKLKSGLWLYSISAAFNPVRGFRNADATTIPIKIPSYTEEEFVSILECQQYFKRLPADIDKNQIRKHSALIPRMVFYWCLDWNPNLENPFQDVLVSFSDRAIKYYKARIKKTLDRAKDKSKDDKTLIHQTMAFFYLNIPVVSLTEQWENSGLFINEKSEMDRGEYVYKCVCPPVSKAIAKYFQEYAKPTIDVLVGRALELLVSRHFRRGGISTISLADKDLMGQERQVKKLNVSVSIDLEQTKPLINTPILPGTFLILRRGHPACDFIAYSSENRGELFFIQISISSYVAHDSKVTDLEKIPVKGNKSILECYVDLCQTEDGNKRFSKVKAIDIENLGKKLPKGVYYVYITTSDSVIRSNNSVKDHPVILVQGDDIKSVVGPDWEWYKNKF
ncbi:hypothetical protein BC938DRAFT_478673 [Jimgerdemannia flammicorona]|uniref:Uncharacterized protein n=1 Tax=Jimgerdemannia flammicorona TaxID=994334 RepID=A0A433QMH6_9FUNG|nr:hypothetical protein BC938DRAFT_478673 [Jimgerdemannia flammicorona]